MELADMNMGDTTHAWTTWKKRQVWVVNGGNVN